MNANIYTALYRMFLIIFKHSIFIRRKLKMRGVEVGGGDIHRSS